MDLTLRKAVSDDLDAVRFIGVSTWPPTYGATRGARYVMRGLDEFWNSAAIGEAIDRGSITVAEDGHGIVGMSEVTDLGADLVLWKLYMLPAAQGRGIGGRLVRAAQDRARTQRRNLVTEHDSENRDAGRFYEREGFAPTEAPWPGTTAVWLRWCPST